MALDDRLISILILAFPIVFMLHEFEEIIGLRPWLAHNGAWLADKFPAFRKPIECVAELSISAFAVAVCEEFLIVSAVSVGAVLWGWYYAWVAVVLAFTLHLVVHIVQWAVVRRYIPMIVTSIACLPYCAYAIAWIVQRFTGAEVLICLLGGTLFMVLNLVMAHKMSAMFDKWRAIQNDEMNK